MAVPNKQEKKFLGVYFVGCNVYGRCYANKTRDAYLGHCPKCGCSLRVKAGSGGQNINFVKAYCNSPY